MFKNYFKIAFRAAVRQKAFSFINLSGLAVGLTSFMLILLYVHLQLSFDQFHEKKERVFRVHDGEDAITANAMGPYIARTYEEEVVDQARLIFMGGQFFKVEEDKFSETVLFADDSFFNLFTFPLIYGNPDNVLSQPHSMVFTRTAAMKRFGSLDVIGDTFEMEGEQYQVTGIMEDPPTNSRLQFDYLAPLQGHRMGARGEME